MPKIKAREQLINTSMKNINLNFRSIEDQFSPYGNRRYGERHFKNFLKEAILKMDITEKKIKNKLETTVNLQFYSDYYEINDTSLVLDSIGKYKKSKCNCGFHSSYEPCGHVWILAKYLKENQLPVPYVYRDENYHDVHKFVEEFHLKKEIAESRRKAHLVFDTLIEYEINNNKDILEKGAVSLVPELFKISEYSPKFYIRFKIGEDKMYIVKDIREKLLEPIKNNEYVEYGKEFKTVFSETMLNEKSIKELYFIKNNIEHTDKNVIKIDWKNVDDFYELHKDNLGIQGLDFCETDFAFTLGIKKVKDYYQINILSKISQVDNLDWSSIENDYMITNNRFYQLIQEQNRYKLLYMETNREEVFFYNTIKNNDIYFTEKEIAGVIDMFQYKLKNIDIPQEILEKFSTEEVIKPKLYCDINEEIELIINLKYENKDENLYFKKLIKKLMIAGITALKTDYLKLKEKENYHIDQTYKITKDKEVVEFIESILPSLNEDCDVFVSDSIKNYSHARTLNLTVGVKVNHNLLNLQFLSDDIDPKEIYDILSRYKKKKKYYKMNSGEIIKLDRNQMEDLDTFIQDMGVDEKELKKNNIKVPNYRRYRLSSEKSIEIETDTRFENLFEKKEVTINSKYENVLRDYQKDGVKFILDLRHMKLGGLLADDMGLGKTLQVIAAIESIKNRKKPILIVTPSSLILNWEAEFNKFQSTLTIKTILGNKQDRNHLIMDIKNHERNDILITSYDYLKRDIEIYKEMQFDTVVLDEAQYIKNYKTKGAKAVKELNRDYAIALTGTPIENSLAEIWSVFDFLMPGYLFNYNKFSKNYEKPIVLENNEKVTKRLKAMVEPFILRRLKKDVLTELPDKIEETYYIELSQEEKEIYKANVLDIKMKLNAGMENNKIEILSMLTRLRQICIDVGLVYDKIYEESAKIKATMELIEQGMLGKQNMLIFSSFTGVLDTIAEKCNENNIQYFMLTGATDKFKRKEYVERFQNGEASVFLISLKAGGTGLNLTNASLVIHIDPWWNISAQNQATDRAYRIGQKNTVQVINLIAKDTIEEKIQKMQEQKKELSDTFVENSEGNFAKLSKEELMSLFTTESL